ncbi:hypothetical protein R1sor_004547 [Riccia sorocarpa]|uniref:C-terminal of Roc (COR) domain-containing protein n=1 Tax=Riccia sorocarpa TaxID=122646 RepID=A0ABD3HLB5_9MARC
MEGIRPSAEAGPEIITGKRYDTRSWTSWEVLKGLLGAETSGLGRLLLLEDFGSCKSVRSVNTAHIRGCLRDDHERKALRDPLKLNPNLEEISITLNSNDDTRYWSWREVLRNSSTLRKLELIITGEGLTDYLVSPLEEFVYGLRGSPNSPLEELVIEVGSSLPKLSVTPIADMVQCSSRLHRIALGVFKDLDGTEIQALSDSLKQSSSLRTLEVKYGTESMSEVLLEVYKGMGSTRCVNNLHLWEGQLKGLVSVLLHLMKATIAHITIHRNGLFGSTPVCRRDHWRETGRPLLEGTVVQTLSLNCGASCGILSRIEQVFETSQRSPNLSFLLYSDCLSREHQDALMSFLALARLRHIHLTMGDCWDSSVLEEAMDSISKNEDVETCSVGYDNSRRALSPTDSLPGLVWLGPRIIDRPNKRLVFHLVLEKIFLSSSIKHLTLERSFFDGRNVSEEEFKQLLLLSHRSTTLRTLEVQCEDWVLAGKVANLQDAINRNAKRNARHAQFISTVRQAGLHFSRIKAGRILICGSPYAGKTRLRKSMLEVASTWYLPLWRRNFLPRTNGIEITTLRDDDEMNLTLWDLGGQWIFRSLQNLLFPKAGQACIFLFVFNPVEMVEGRPSRKADLPSAFRKEVTSWLRFIASNYPVATDLPPQVMVVFSHKDKVQECERDLSWAREIVLQLQTCFEGKVDLSLREKDLHFINSFDSTDVSRVRESVVWRIESVFDKLVERQLVPSPAAELISLLTKRSDRIRKNPVWSSSDLYQYICSQNIGLQHLDPQTAPGCLILQSLEMYLHDVGVIIRIPDSDLIVVDPGWLTEKFLGEFINYGHDFQPGKISKQFSGTWGRDGFIDAQLFSIILAHLVKTYRQEDVHVPVDILRELLFKLDLCFQVDSYQQGRDRRYFMPSVCGFEEKSPIRKLQWSSGCHGSSKDFGFRLQCYDRERTCFTRSFFPTFQVKLRNELVQKRVADVRCSQGLMEIREDGIQIFIETDELGEDHIDIMVRSSPHKTKKKAEQFVQENVVKFLRSFCASEMGCMGVSLSEHILRIQCVTQLTPRGYRGDDQVVSVVELKNRVVEDARKELEACDRKKVQFDAWLESCMETGLRYAQWWPETMCPDLQTCLLPEGTEVAKDLLTVEIQESIRKQLKGIADDLEEEKYFRHRAQQGTGEGGVVRINDEVIEVYAPVGVPQLELIFVHGIHDDEMDSNPYLTRWSTRDKREECWLNTWLLSQTEVDLRQARILTVTYDSSIKKNSEHGNMCIFLVAENLRYSLIKDAGVGQLDSCPVLIVCHSLGGLLMKEVCVQASHVQSRQDDVTKYKNFLSNIRGFFFYSTPHSGLKLFGSGGSSFLTSQPELQGYRVEPGNSQSKTRKRTLKGESSIHPVLLQLGDLMKRLELYDTSCARTNEEFENLREREDYKWETRGVCESNPTKVMISKDAAVEIYVEEGSARPGCRHGFWKLPYTDHFTICRPESVTSNSFQLLLTFIKELV